MGGGVLGWESVFADYRKWPDLPHYRFSTWRLGEDVHGVWLGMPAGTPFAGPRDGSFLTANVLLVPRTGWWTAKFRPASADIPLYVDVCVPPRWTRDRLIAIDLDLDILRTSDGTVLVDDEDEFEQHRIELAYPEWLTRGAQQAAAELMVAVREGREPFGRTSELWLDRLDSLPLEA